MSASLKGAVLGTCNAADWRAISVLTDRRRSLKAGLTLESSQVRRMAPAPPYNPRARSGRSVIRPSTPRPIRRCISAASLTVHGRTRSLAS